MRLFLILAVFAMIAVGRCADAGIIVGVPAVQEHVTDDMETLMLAMSPAEEPASAPVEVEQGVSDLPEGLAGTTNSSVAPAAAVLQGITLRTDAQWQWCVESANSILPPSPDCDGLLKPA